MTDVEFVVAGLGSVLYSNIIFQFRGGAVLFPQQWSGKYWCFNDWPLTSRCPDQEESGGHAESRPLLSAHRTPDAPLQPVHHDNLQRALRGQCSAHVRSQGLCISAYLILFTHVYDSQLRTAEFEVDTIAKCSYLISKWIEICETINSMVDHL